MSKNNKIVRNAKQIKNKQASRMKDKSKQKVNETKYTIKKQLKNVHYTSKEPSKRYCER